MSTTTRERPPDLDYDVEQEVDFGRWLGALLVRWWLPVLGLVVGALVGYAISLGGTQVYRAQATIYLGQPYGGLNSTVQIVSLQTNPTTVRQIVTADSSIDAAAAAAGVPSDQLRGKVTSSAVSSSTSAKLVQAPLVTITVTSKRSLPARIAANKLANIAVLRLATYTRAKIDRLKQQISGDDTQLAALDRLTRSADPATAALVAIERGQVANDRLVAAQLLTQAQQVESPRIVTAAAAHRVTARSRRNTMLVAGLIGLLLGIAAALLWEPLAGRFARR